MFMSTPIPGVLLPFYLFPGSLFLSQIPLQNVVSMYSLCSVSFKGSSILSFYLALSALPPRFIEDLRSQEATEGTMVTLRCQMNKAPSSTVEWRKGSESLRDGGRYSLRQDGAVCELQIQGLTLEDAGEYSCVCGQERTSATLSVKGKDHLWPPEPEAWCLHVVSLLCLFSM